MTRLSLIAVAASGLFAMTGTASAQMRDAIYRGALTCTKALFVKDAERPGTYVVNECVRLHEGSARKLLARSRRFASRPRPALQH